MSGSHSYSVLIRELACTARQRVPARGNTLYQLLRGKLTLSQLKPGHPDKPSVRGCINREDIVEYFQCLFMLPITSKVRLWRGGRRHGTGLPMCSRVLPPSRVLSMFTGMGEEGVNLVASETWPGFGAAKYIVRVGVSRH